MKSIVVNTIETFFNEVEEYKGRHYFRGQANCSWDISPSIFRNSSFLSSEYNNINERYSNGEHKRILCKILEMQHYSKPTRLCDLTINPLVSLFFAIDGDKELANDGCIYVLDCSEKLQMDSIQIKIMTKIACSDISNVNDLIEEIHKDFGVELSVEEILDFICQNAIVEYGYELAFSNSRAHLQGGTAIFFGFSTPDGVHIERSNTYGIHNIVKKLIIPSNKKEYFLNDLISRGITSETLYDKIFEYRRTKVRPIKYNVEIDYINRKPDFNKVVLWIKVSEIRFDYDDIFIIVNEVFNRMKLEYGRHARIFILVYYDYEDKRAGNNICHTSPIDDFSNFTMSWNKDYHKRRMEYSNHQISTQEITEKLEPLILESLHCWKLVKNKNDDLRKNDLSREEYNNFLNELFKKLRKKRDWDMNDIAHGGDRVYEYHEISCKLIEDITFLIEDQLMYLDRMDNDYLLQKMYDSRNKDCEESYDHYIERRQLLL